MTIQISLTLVVETDNNDIPVSVTEVIKQTIFHGTAEDVKIVSQKSNTCLQRFCIAMF